MKKILVTILVVITVMSVSAQTLKYDEVPYLKAKTMSYLEFDKYISSNGSNFKVGDKIRIGKPSALTSYNYITLFVPLANPSKATSGLAGKEFRIKKIRVNKSLGNNLVSLWLDFGLGGSSYIVEIEPALESGEIVGDGMTEEQALKEIEILKKKFELEIITEEEYKSKKAELIKFIK